MRLLSQFSFQKTVIHDLIHLNPVSNTKDYTKKHSSITHVPITFYSKEKILVSLSDRLVRCFHNHVRLFFQLHR